MPEIEVTLRVTYGSKTVKITHTDDDFGGGDGVYPVIRELIRKAADAGARAFPNPRSPYSDDLFKVSQQGNVSNVEPKTRDEDEDDDKYAGLDVRRV